MLIPEPSFLAPTTSNQEEAFMNEALKEAQKAFEIDEVPVGAVIVQENKIIARAYNLKEKQANPVAHAEILAIQKAANKLNSWRLQNCDLYVTLEPCPMCAGAIIHARIRNLYWGTDDPKTGACGSLYQITEDYRLNHQTKTFGPILKENCSNILSTFFKMRRQQLKKNK